MKKQKKVCAIIVTYNRLEVLKKALNHISDQSRQPDTIIVVDNNSIDGSKGFITSIDNQNSIRGLFLKNNIGYAGGIAKGMEYALTLEAYDYFWIMDDDTYYTKDALEQLVDHMEQSEYGMIGLTGFQIKRGEKIEVKSNQQLQNVDYVLIDGALVKHEVVEKIGMPSEKFFMMCEDWEYCLRVRKNGFKVGLLNGVTADRLFLGGQGGGYSRSTLWRGYYQARNHFLIMRQYFSIGHLYGHLKRQVQMIFSALLYAPDRGVRIKFRLLGMWHGIIGVGGKTLDPETLEFRKEKAEERLKPVKLAMN